MVVLGRHWDGCATTEGRREQGRGVVRTWSNGFAPRACKASLVQLGACGARSARSSSGSTRDVNTSIGSPPLAQTMDNCTISATSGDELVVSRVRASPTASACLPATAAIAMGLVSGSDEEPHA